MGTRVKEIREQNGMSQEELAYKAGLCRATVSAIESDPHKKPTVRTLEKIARALGVSLDRIFFDEDAQSFSQNSTQTDGKE